MPTRIRRRRTRAWRLSSTAMIVDRTSRYGNPFRMVDGLFVQAPDAEPWNGRQWTCGTPDEARVWASVLYADWLGGEGLDGLAVGRRTFDRRRILADLPLLRGKDLACPCPLPAPGQPDHCHAALLLDLANGAAS